MIYFFPTIYMDTEPTCAHFRFIALQSKDKKWWDMVKAKRLCPGVWYSYGKPFRDYAGMFKKVTA